MYEKSENVHKEGCVVTEDTILLRFGDFELDETTLRVTLRGESVACEPLVFRTLHFLALKAGTVVTKRQLHEQLWQGTAVTDWALSRAIAQARKVLQLGTSKELLETIRARGYRLNVNPAMHRRTGTVFNPFIGRQEQCAALDSLLDQLEAGQGNVLLFAGEPGIGKTRLLEEVLARSQQRDIVSGVGRGSEVGAPSDAFQPWTDVLSQLLEQSWFKHEKLSPDAVECFVDNMPGLRNLIPEPEQRLPGVPPNAAQSAFRLASHIDRLSSRSRPAVVAIDDLLRIDDESFNVFSELCSRAADHGLLLVGTFRDTEPGPKLDAIELILRLPRVRLLQLRGFDAEESVAYWRSLTNRALSDAQFNQFREHSAGNPLFLKLLIEHGTNRRVPALIYDTVLLHISTLDTNCQRALATASLIGRSFELDLLAAVLAENATAVIEQLEHAVRAGVLRRLGTTNVRFQFVHAIIPEALVTQMGFGQQRDKRQAIAAALQRSQPAALGQIAHHLLESALPGRASNAIDFARRAASEAGASHAHDHAVTHLRRAYELAQVEPTYTKQALKLVALELSESLIAVNHLGEAYRVLSTHMNEREPLEDPQVTARTALALAGLPIGLNLSEAGRHLEYALRQRNALDVPTQTRLLLSFSDSLYFTDTSRAEDCAREALALARDFDSDTLIADSLSALKRAISTPDRMPERTALAEEQLARALGLEDAFRIVLARMNHCSDLLELNRIDQIIEEMNAHDRFKLRRPSLLYDWYSAHMHSLLELLDNRPQAAEEYALKGHAIGKRIGHVVNDHVFGIQVLAIGLKQKTVSKYRRFYNERLKEYRSTGWLVAEAFSALEVGEVKSARQSLALIKKNWGNYFVFDITWISACGIALDLAHALEDEELSLVLEEQLEPYRSRQCAVQGMATYGAIADKLPPLRNAL